MGNWKLWLLGFCGAVLLVAGCGGGSTGDGPRARGPSGASDQGVSDAYACLMSRVLVLRQQRADLQEGFQWNTLVHRKPGDVQWPNPNLDVAYTKAWVAVDESSCLMVSVPRITGRYCTVQFLNGWGETVANINEGGLPRHPYGEFAACLQGSQVNVPAGAQRVDVPERYMRVQLRVELGANWDEAVALRRKIEFHTTGNPTLPTVPKTVMFDLETLHGVEAFVAAELALDSEVNITPGMEQLQASTRSIAKAIQDPAERQRVDHVIRSWAFDDIKRAMPTLADGTVPDGRVLASMQGTHGTNWLLCTLVNYGGIWANTFDEVVCYRAFVGPDGAPLSGDRAYTLLFSKERLPAHHAAYFWSVIAVDAVHRRVLPSPGNAT